MSCYTSCAFECPYKDLARKIFKDLNNAGIPTFFSGDVPDKRRSDILSEMVNALEKSQVFIPMISQAFEQHRDCPRELGMAFESEKMIIPVVVEPGISLATVRPFLTGIRISDMSSPDKYEANLLELIQTIRTLIPGKKDARTGSEAGDGDQDI